MLPDVELSSIPSLPSPATPLIGRARDIEVARARLRQSDVRLLTLVGPGGVGKTRLALAIAEGLQADFPDGIWFIDLSALRDPIDVIPEIAQALDVREARGQPLVDRLKARLRSRCLLLVLDNFEQVLAAAADVGGLVSTSRRLKFLVTSRAALRVRAEQVFPVSPLSLVDDLGAKHAAGSFKSAAVALFVERAQATRPDFRWTPDNGPAIVEICARLDGLPLAIELAAAQVRLLAPWAIAARLTGSSGTPTSLRVLANGPRDLPPRQRTLRDAIAWSCNLLGAADQALFRRLSVFAGAFTLEATIALVSRVRAAIEPSAVVAAESAPADETTAGDAELIVLQELGALVKHSLLARELGPTPDQPDRCRMLATVREYGLERLVEAGEAEVVAEAHAQYYLALAEEAEPHLDGPDQVRWLDTVEADHDNLRAALRWATEPGRSETALRLVGALWRFWEVRGHFAEGRRWAAAALAAGISGAARLRARALSGAGTLAWRAGDVVEAERLHRESAELYQIANDAKGYAFALNNEAVQLMEQGNAQAANALYQQSLAQCRALGDRSLECMVVLNLGVLHAVTGEVDRAKRYYEEALSLVQADGNEREALMIRHNLAELALQGGEPRLAGTLARANLRALLELNDKWLAAGCLAFLGEVAAAEGMGRSGAVLFGASRGLAGAIEGTLPPDEVARQAEVVAQLRASLGEADFAAAWTRGRAMTMAEAIQLALDLATGTAESSGTPLISPVAESVFPLTLRQQEVAALVARGWSNQEIASVLVISPRTAETHVQHILAKLDLTSRSQLAVWAHQHGLVPEQ
jgi:non-specific serine/threonine protein kinase